MNGLSLSAKIEQLASYLGLGLLKTAPLLDEIHMACLLKCVFVIKNKLPLAHEVSRHVWRGTSFIHHVADSSLQ